MSIDKFFNRDKDRSRRVENEIYSIEKKDNLYVVKFNDKKGNHYIINVHICPKDILEAARNVTW